MHFIRLHYKPRKQWVRVNTNMHTFLSFIGHFEKRSIHGSERLISTISCLHLSLSHYSKLAAHTQFFTGMECDGIPACYWHGRQRSVHRCRRAVDRRSRSLQNRKAASGCQDPWSYSTGYWITSVRRSRCKTALAKLVSLPPLEPADPWRSPAASR